MNSKQLFLAPFLLSLLLLTACADKPKSYFVDNGTVFHTLYQIKYESEQPLTLLIDEEFNRFNLSLNPFIPNSIITKVNKNEPVEVDAWFTEVFRKAEEVSTQTDGYFDITCAPLVNLWGFGFSKMDSITPAMIDSIMPYVGYTKVHLEGKTVRKDDPRTLLNCSAIAKGYACDVIASLLEREGVTNYMVEIGGEVTMSGVNPNGEGWRIGIKKPEEDSTGVKKNVEEIVQLGGKGGIATSGDYLNFYVKEGKKFAHTINPKTGYPAEQNVLSATIVANNCLTADAYATAFMAMGKEKAERVGAAVPEIEYFIIYLDEAGKKQIAYSPGMLQYLPNRKELAVLENP